MRFFRQFFIFSVFLHKDVANEYKVVEDILTTQQSIVDNDIAQKSIQSLNEFNHKLIKQRKQKQCVADNFLME